MSSTTIDTPACKAARSSMSTSSKEEGFASTAPNQTKSPPAKTAAQTTGSVTFSRKKLSDVVPLHSLRNDSSKPSKYYLTPTKLPTQCDQYNCKFWVTKGYCLTRGTTCKWRHDKERRNVWPWHGDQDEVFPDMVGQYSE